MIGKTDHDFFPASVADVYRQHDAEVAKAGTVMNFEEVALVNGSLRWYCHESFHLRRGRSDHCRRRRGDGYDGLVAG